MIYSKKGEWDKALEYYLKSEKIRIEVGDKAGLGYTSLNIATVYYQLNNKKAKQYIDQAIGIFSELGAPHELGIAGQWQKGIYKKFS